MKPALHNTPTEFLFWALKQQTGNPIRNLILIHLGNRAGKDGSCFPSHSTIARDCGCSVRSVKYQIAELEKAELIKVKRRAVDGMKTSSIYTLNIAAADRQELPHDRQDVHGVVQEMPHGRANGALGVVQEMPIETPITKHPIKHPVKHTPITPSDFDCFYSAYPKKVGRREALKAWNKLKPQPALINRIMIDIVDRVEKGAWCIGQGKQYIPGPAPYLNQERWTDEIIPRPESKKDQDFSKMAREAEEMIF